MVGTETKPESEPETKTKAILHKAMETSGRTSGEALIVLTGGGTAGHVSAHLQLIDGLWTQGWQVRYVGSLGGMEQGLLAQSYPHIPYTAVGAGKWRRYWSWRNITDIFKTLYGIVQAYVCMRCWRPRLVLSRGGYVSFPAVMAAWLLRVPVVLLEIDMRPGLAARLSFPFVDKVLYAFPKSADYMPPSVSSYRTGVPFAEGALEGDVGCGMELCGFSEHHSHPVVLVMGGSQGSAFLHGLLGREGESLVATYRVVVLTGKAGCGPLEGELESLQKRHPGRVKVFSYLYQEELRHIYAVADVAITRGGAQSVFELLACRVPMLVVPLTRGSRGDQVDNGRCFEEQGWARMVDEGRLAAEGELLRQVDVLYQSRQQIRKAMAEGDQGPSAHTQILEQIKEYGP